MKIYKTTEAQRRASSKYSKTPKGKAVTQRYNQKPENREKARIREAQRNRIYVYRQRNETRKYTRLVKPKIPIQIIIERDGDGFHAYCPALKGLHTEGNTRLEALYNAHLAAKLYIESCIKHGDSIPTGKNQV